MSTALSGPDTLLAGLDAQQRVAAEALFGPVCILAGAGTGKTRAITHRIAYGVASGAYAPNRVMALTFTSRAAAELRGRLRQLGAGGVSARTFHSAALSQLNYFWPQVVGGQLPSVLDGKGRVLGQAAEALKLRVDTATLRDVAAEVEWRKVSGLGIEQYSAAGRPTPGSLTADQVAGLLQKYEELKDQRKQIDFEDVLLACAGMIESEPAVALQVREQYRFFVVDEYQDVSPLQHQLLSLWLGTRTDLCVVGDASQTIYSFAGARSDYLLGFEREHPGATVVRLEQNYRSTPSVIDVANRLMRGRSGALTLRPAELPGGARDVDPVPEPTAYEDDRAEARAVAQRIAAELAAGSRPEHIAVLYRVNVQSAALEQALGDLGISYQIRGSKRFFDLPEVRQAVMSLRAASLAATDDPLFKSVSDVLRSLGWSVQPPEARGAVRERWESLNAIMGLADEQPPGRTLRAFTDELLARQAGQHEPTMSAVTLATLHAAKGLEWPSVYLVGLSEGLVPISYATTFEQVDEERRLLYVGITRARERLRLSWAARGNQPGRPSSRQPSRFLSELRPTVTPGDPGSRTPGAAPTRG
ncbi:MULTISPECIES: ATP-dependent helicase [unclassified Leifsonia]|uniref:ATP-dependent helicase n=1 Tax=unclassified Leifsonia TaxID=2663824 RepID=UPI0008A72EE3|nr:MULTISPECIES: ATP-dependent helicase [unclassified Leifsonia]SEH75393.1 ATP-dependent DNA helicase, Rep family [Leifsonia sp. CL154]SFL36842.1 ATP-dependent DNA helicase, Rep family [Leifsonia sp. CL147]